MELIAQTETRNNRHYFRVYEVIRNEDGHPDEERPILNVSVSNHSVGGLYVDIEPSAWGLVRVWAMEQSVYEKGE